MLNTRNTFWIMLQISATQAMSGNQVSPTTLDKKKLRVELKAVRLTASVVGVFAVLWTPYIIGKIIDISHVNPVVGHYIGDVGAALGILNSSINWVIYGLASRDFRTAVLKMLTA
jgi:hypothetical protein